MHLTWHIVRKDLLRLRLPLAIWSTLQLLTQLVPLLVWTFPSLTAGDTEFLLYTLVGIQALAWLAAFDFAIRLVQEDSASRTDVFWRTRPVSGLRLLATKLLALLLFTALTAIPALLFTLITSPAARPSIIELLEVTLQTHFLLAALAFPFAALTRSYRQSLLFSITTYAALLALVAWAHIIYDPAGTDIYQPRITLATLTALITAATLLVSQYTTGRISRSLRIAGVGALATALILTVWPWRFPLSQPSLPLASDEPAETRDLTLAYEKSLLWDKAEFGPKSKRPVLNLDLTVSGFPSGHFLRRQAIYYHWQDNAAPSFRKLGNGLSPDPDARVILSLIQPSPPLPSITVQSQIPASFAALLRSKQPPAPYRADVVFDLHRAEITEISLTPGHWASTTEGQIRLLTVNPQTATLRILERRVSFARRRFIVFTETDQFILYNPRTGEALRGMSSAVSISSLKQHELTFGPIQDANVINRATPLTDEFLRDARLVKISFPIVGTFARTVEVPAVKPRLSR